MRRMWKGCGCLGAFLLTLAACKPTETRIQPPPLHEEYVLPPDDDARFSAPPSFPKEARTDGLRKPSAGPNQLPPSLRGGPGGAGGLRPGGY